MSDFTELPYFLFLFVLSAPGTEGIIAQHLYASSLRIIIANHLCASWLCYYKALQIGDASKVVPIDKLSVVITLILAFIFLHEEFTVKSVVGCVLIGAGTILMVL